MTTRAAILTYVVVASIAHTGCSSGSGPLTDGADGSALPTDALTDVEQTDGSTDGSGREVDGSGTATDVSPDGDDAADTAAEDGTEGSDSTSEDPDDDVADDAADDGSSVADTTVPLWRSDDSFGTLPAFESGTQHGADLFHGVRLVSRQTDEPRPLVYYVVQIDPTIDGIEWMVTPANGDAVARETTRQTTWDFADAHALSVAINAHFFSPWPAEDPWADVLGASMSDGDGYSECSAQWDEVLMVDGAGRVSIRTCDEYTELLSSPAADDRPRNAIGTNDRIVTDGVVTANWEELHPRTAVGINGSGQLLLLVADGRQDGVSEGLTTPEVAEILIEFGATQALNLDGGGSTTLVVSDPDTRVVNRPIGYLIAGTERENGSNFGLRAPPIPTAPAD
jgi:hypothetical protein